MGKPKSRGNGEGTIFQRDKNTWVAEVTTGRDPETGRLKRQTIYGKEKKEVKEEMDRIKYELNMGIYVEPTKLTVGEWFDTWLKDYKTPPYVKLSTYVSYEMYIRVHIKPVLGDTPLKELRPEQLQRFYNQKFKSGRSDGAGGLSAKTIRNIHNMVHECLSQAIKNGLLMRNVSEAVTLPKVVKKEVRIMTSKEEKLFIRALEGERLKPAFITDLNTGLRLGELLGLSWDNVDFQNKVIKVRQSLNRLKNLDDNAQTKTRLYLEKGLKTKKSRRDIPISDYLVSVLKQHKQLQSMEGVTNINNLVFCSEAGTPYEPRSFIRKMHAITEKAGIPRVNVHSMRHTFASRLLEAGVDLKIVQELLGHENISLTADTYTHVSQDLKRSAIDKLNQFNRNQNLT